MQFSEIPSPGLQWENKTYKPKRSIIREKSEQNSSPQLFKSLIIISLLSEDIFRDLTVSSVIHFSTNEATTINEEFRVLV